SDARVGRAEARCVEGVQGFDAELHSHSLEGRELFEERQVEVPDAVVADVYRRADTPECERRGLAVGARAKILVQPLVYRATKLWVLAFGFGAGQGIDHSRRVVRGDGQWRAALERGDAVELPAADQSVEQSGRIAP